MALSESQVPVATLTTSPQEARVPTDRQGKLGPRRRLRWQEAGLVLLVMGTLAVAWFWHTWTAPAAHSVGAGADTYPVIWTLAWVPYALGHGLNPLLTHYLAVPHGINLMWNPMMPLLALLVSPITVTAGPVVAYNVIATAAPALAGWAAYLAIRRWTAPAPALLGALVFGFSPFIGAESSQNVFLTFLVTAPLMLIALDRLLVVQQAPAWQDGIFLGLLVGAQLLINEEILVIEIIVAVAAVIVAAAFDVRVIRAKIKHATRGIAVAGAGALVLGAWPLAVQFLGPYRPKQGYISLTTYSADLWNFVSPTYTTALRTSSAISLDQHFTVNWTEWGAYLGIPLVVLLIGCLVLCRRRRVAWVAATIVVSAAVLSLGPSLHVAGRDTGIPLPWRLLAHLPAFHDLEPVRAAAPMFLGAGLLLALGLHELRHRAPALRAGAYGLAIFSLAVLVPVAPYYTNPVPADASLASGAACPAHPQGRLFVLPSSEQYTLFLQAETGFCFTMPTYYGFHGTYDGPTMYGFHGGRNRPTLALDQASWAATLGEPLPALTPTLRARAARELVALKLKEVILAPTPPPANPQAHARLVEWVTALLGTPRPQGDVLVWGHPQVRSAS